MIRNYLPRYARVALFTEKNIRKNLDILRERKEEELKFIEQDTEFLNTVKGYIEDGGQKVVREDVVEYYEDKILQRFSDVAQINVDIKKLEEALELKNNADYMKGISDYANVVILTTAIAYTVGKALKR